MENREAVMDYVLTRPLVRPKTSIFRAVLYIILFLMSVAVLSSVCYAVPSVLGAFSYLPGMVRRWMEAHPIWHKALYSLIWYAVSFLCVAKKAFIGAIRLYQHYADEQIRRRCTCMPTCSEYSILCLQKYNLIKALRMIYVRLFKKCGSDDYDYRADWP